MPKRKNGRPKSAPVGASKRRRLKEERDVSESVASVSSSVRNGSPSGSSQASSKSPQNAEASLPKARRKKTDASKKRKQGALSPLSRLVGPDTMSNRMPMPRVKRPPGGGSGSNGPASNSNNSSATVGPRVKSQKAAGMGEARYREVLQAGLMSRDLTTAIRCIAKAVQKMSTVDRKSSREKTKDLRRYQEEHVLAFNEVKTGLKKVFQEERHALNKQVAALEAELRRERERPNLASNSGLEDAKKLQTEREGRNILLKNLQTEYESVTQDNNGLRREMEEVKRAYGEQIKQFQDQEVELRKLADEKSAMLVQAESKITSLELALAECEARLKQKQSLGLSTPKTKSVVESPNSAMIVPANCRIQASDLQINKLQTQLERVSEEKAFLEHQAMTRLEEKSLIKSKLTKLSNMYNRLIKVDEVYKILTGLNIEWRDEKWHCGIVDPSQEVHFKFKLWSDRELLLYEMETFKHPDSDVVLPEFLTSGPIAFEPGRAPLFFKNLLKHVLDGNYVTTSDEGSPAMLTQASLSKVNTSTPAGV